MPIYDTPYIWKWGGYKIHSSMWTYCAAPKQQVHVSSADVFIRHAQLSPRMLWKQYKEHREKISLKHSEISKEMLRNLIGFDQISLKNAAKRGKPGKLRFLLYFAKKRGPQRGKRSRVFSVSLIIIYLKVVLHDIPNSLSHLKSTLIVIISYVISSDGI